MRKCDLLFLNVLFLFLLVIFFGAEKETKKQTMLLEKQFIRDKLHHRNVSEISAVPLSMG